MGEALVNVVIGRTNPPHAGHIKLMTAAIEAARAAPGPIKCALILLGNGPEGQRTNEDPIDHDTKSTFLIKKLRAVSYEDKKGHFFIEGVDFVVMQMYTSEEGGPSENISEFLQHFEIPVDYTGSIRMVQYTGNKPGKINNKTENRGPSDPEKHKSLRAYIQSNIKNTYNYSANVTCDVKSVEADKIEGEQPMSATKVRKAAVKCFEAHGDNGDSVNAAHDGYSCWIDKYKFYNGDAETRELSRQMFDAIIRFRYITIKKSSSKKRKRRNATLEEEGAEEYIEPKLVKSRTGVKSPRPGGSRRKRTRRRISRLRNKKTIRHSHNHNIRRHRRR